MTNIINNGDLKNINSVNNTASQVINNSILVNDEKTLNLVRQVIAQRGMSSRFSYDVPESFDSISKSTFSVMQEIDKAHQKNVISRDVAIEMIADLFEGDAISGRFDKCVNDLYLEKLKKLYKLMEIRYQDLLHALNTGKIEQKEFLERYTKLQELQKNSISELLTSDETLRQHTR